MKYLIYTSARPPGLLKKAAALVTMAGLIVVGLVFSAILIPIVLAVIAVAAAYLWWKTRELRRLMKQMRNFPPGGMGTANSSYRREEKFEGEIIEGEATRVDESAGRIRN